MDKKIWVQTLAIAFCMLTVGCNTTSNVRITDTVRKVVTYETDKKVRVLGEKIEMEDPINSGQWWEAKKISGGSYVFTAKGMENKKRFEDQQTSVDEGGSGDDGY